jgi:hypothetical protein
MRTEDELARIFERSENLISDTEKRLLTCPLMPLIAKRGNWLDQKTVGSKSERQVRGDAMLEPTATR